MEKLPNMSSRVPENKPKWKRLNDFQCPKCNKQLGHDDTMSFYVCPNKEGCGFVISQPAFNRVVRQIQRGYARPKVLGDDTEALAYLNNYGHNKQSADFSGDEKLADKY